MTQNSIKLTQIEPVKNESKLVKSIKNKRIKTPILINENDAEEAAILMSFNRKNPNLEWQEEDEEVLNSAQSTLRCEANK